MCMTCRSPGNRRIIGWGRVPVVGASLAEARNKPRISDARGGDPAGEQQRFILESPHAFRTKREQRKIAAAWARVGDARRPAALFPRRGALLNQLLLPNLRQPAAAEP